MKHEVDSKSSKLLAPRIDGPISDGDITVLEDHQAASSQGIVTIHYEAGQEHDLVMFIFCDEFTLGVVIDPHNTVETLVQRIVTLIGDFELNQQHVTIIKVLIPDERSHLAMAQIEDQCHELSSLLNERLGLLPWFLTYPVHPEQDMDMYPIAISYDVEWKADRQGQITQYVSGMLIVAEGRLFPLMNQGWRTLISTAIQWIRNWMSLGPLVTLLDDARFRQWHV